MKLSVVMPVYNESTTLREVVQKVLSVPMEIELICVDDGSRDGSREILAELQSEHPQIRAVLQPHNMGKGAALRRGIQEATGDFVIIQDADLEYDPAEYPLMIEPLIQGFEPEIPVKVARRKLRIYEVGISYWGRTYEEGKKIGWKDGVRALYCLLKYSLKEPSAKAVAQAVPAPGRSSVSR